MSIDVLENRAFDLGRERFAWWPDWRGKYVAIVACGPSLRNVDLGKIRGKLKVIAIKEAALERCPWADVLYGCDWPWWKYRRGAPQFKGLKFGWDTRIKDHFRDVHRVEIKDPKLDRILMDEPLSLGSGRNSGFQAFNLACQFGPPKGILTVALDVRDDGGAHFYGRNIWESANNPTNDNFVTWIKAFNGVAALLKNLGIDVVNASPVSKLECFRKASIEQALAEWNL